MNKTKEDAQVTRQNLLDAARDCFMENGYNQTSLSMVAMRADYTRGAVYWHFKDKADLFRAVYEDTMQKASVTEYFRRLPADMDYGDKLVEVFWHAQTDPHVAYINKILRITNFVEGFEDIEESIRMEKIKLIRIFAEETRLHIGLKKTEPAYAIDVYAANLFFLFEGLFFTKDMNVGIDRNKEHIRQYVLATVHDIL